MTTGKGKGLLQPLIPNPDDASNYRIDIATRYGAYELRWFEIDQCYIMWSNAMQSEEPTKIELVDRPQRNANPLSLKVRTTFDTTVFPSDKIIILEPVIASDQSNPLLLEHCSNEGKFGRLRNVYLTLKHPIEDGHSRVITLDRDVQAIAGEQFLLICNMNQGILFEGRDPDRNGFSLSRVVSLRTGTAIQQAAKLQG